MGSSNHAAEDAQKAEDARRAQVSATQAAIESAYGNPQRETDIQSVVNATKQYLTGDLNKQNTVAQRNEKFALARNGTTMGSVDADQHRQLAEQYLKGAIEVQRRANTAGNTLRQADQTSKLGLFSQAQAGLDMTTAVRNAGELMQSNLAGAKSEAMQSGIGDAFKSLGDIYTRSRETAGTNRAEKYQYGTFYAPIGGNAGGF